MSLQSTNIKLRALELTDIDFIYKWENDTNSWFVSNTLVPFSRYILEKYIESSHLDIYQTRQLRLMIVFNNSSETPIGTIDLFDFDPFHNRAGIGILIAEKKHQKKGYASEALKLLIEYCFNTLQLHQLFCNIAQNNITSLNLFEKHNFEISGEKKQWLKDGNNWIDEYFLQLINISDSNKSEFQQKDNQKN
jgi:diamine N-acetyltransferase